VGRIVVAVADVGPSDETLLAAIEALKTAESLLGEVDRLRTRILDTLEELQESVSSLPQVQHELRIMRIRLTAQLSHDPDKTPVEHVKGLSQMAMRAAQDPKKPSG
jgi:hypothetical protein